MRFLAPFVSALRVLRVILVAIVLTAALMLIWFQTIQWLEGFLKWLL